MLSIAIGEKYRIRFLWATGYNIFISQNKCITLFYLCLCLKTPYLTYIVDSLTLDLWPTALQLMSEWSLSNTHIFSIRHITAILTFVTPGSTLALCLGAILNTKIINKKHKNAKSVVLNKLWKGHLFTVWELKQEGRVLPCSISKGNVSAGSWNFLLLCAWVCLQMTAKISQVLILGLQINFSK